MSGSKDILFVVYNRTKHLIASGFIFQEFIDITKIIRPIADYVSGTDFLHSFETGWETKGFLKVPLPSKLRA